MVWLDYGPDILALRPCWLKYCLECDWETDPEFVLWLATFFLWFQLPKVKLKGRRKKKIEGAFLWFLFVYLRYQHRLLTSVRLKALLLYKWLLDARWRQQGNGPEHFGAFPAICLVLLWCSTTSLAPWILPPRGLADMQKSKSHTACLCYSLFTKVFAACMLKKYLKN